MRFQDWHEDVFIVNNAKNLQWSYVDKSFVKLFTLFSPPLVKTGFAWITWLTFLVQNGTFLWKATSLQNWNWNMKVRRDKNWYLTKHFLVSLSSFQTNTEQSLQPTASWSSGIPVTAHKPPSLTLVQHTQRRSFRNFQPKEGKVIFTNWSTINSVPNQWLPSSSKPLNSDAIFPVCLCHNHRPWSHQYQGSTQLWHSLSGKEELLWMIVYKKSYVFNANQMIYLDVQL